MIDFKIGNIYIDRSGDRFVFIEKDGVNYNFEHVDNTAYKKTTDENGKWTNTLNYEHPLDIVAEETN